MQADVYLDANESARDALQNAQIEAQPFGANQYFKVAIFDASGIKTTHELKQVYNFFHPIARSIDRSGRVIVIGLPPEKCTSIAQASAQRALEGFVKSVGKRSLSAVSQASLSM